MHHLFHHRRRTFLKGGIAALSLSTVSSFSGFDLLAQDALSAPPRETQAGFRPLFNGISLKGWSRQIREEKHPGLGVWTVKDGVLIGAQDQPGIGSYLVTDATFADFELEFDARPDWRTDTGVYLRTNAQGNTGFQACIDYRPHGAIGGYFGNNIGSFHVCNYCFTGKLNHSGELIGLVPEKPSEPLDATHNVPLDYAVPPEQFIRNWNLSGWNHFRVRCVGAVPSLTTWINGLEVSALDTAKMKAPDWDPGSVEQRLGRAGHISIEVHSNGSSDWLGNDRWYPGNVCRWRNMSIKEI